MIPPWSFIPVWNFYLIPLSPKRIQCVKAERDLDRSLQELTGSGAFYEAVYAYMCVSARKREEEVIKIRKLSYAFSH